MQTRLLIPNTAVAAPAPVSVDLLQAQYGKISVQVSMTLAASVQMQGRNSPTQAFANIGAAITAAGIIELSLATGEIQAVLTGNTGVVSVSIAY